MSHIVSLFYTNVTFTIMVLLWNTGMYTASQKYPRILFLILKVLFLMKQVKHHSSFIYYTKYNSS